MIAPTAIALSLFAFASSVIAAPINVEARSSPNFVRSSLTHFNNWGGFQSLHNFDDFYGYDNFDGHRNDIILVEKDLVCHPVEIEHVQQQLVIIQEHVKRIIVETVCEVEVQTILLSQWGHRFRNFHHDVRRRTGRKVHFDRKISDHFRELVDEHGAIVDKKWDFKGHDVGKHGVHFKDNWDDLYSPDRVHKAYFDSWYGTAYGDEFFFGSPDFDEIPPSDSPPVEEADDVDDVPPPADDVDVPPPADDAAVPPVDDAAADDAAADDAAADAVAPPPDAAAPNLPDPTDLAPAETCEGCSD